MNRLLLLGVNHATAPLGLRERIAFAPGTIGAAMQSYTRRFPDSELVLLSTCNRVELYTARAVHGHPRIEEMIDFLATHHRLSSADLAPHVYQHSDRAVVEHLFRVSASLDSMVLGETQILGQVRDAYDLARAQNAARSVLHPLFQRAVAVGKQVRSQTSIADGRLSIASVAVDYARRIFERFDDKTVLSVGAGKMGVLVLRHFAALKPKSMIVCSRDAEKASTVAGEFGGTGESMDSLVRQLTVADVVVCSTASTEPILTAAMFDHIVRARRGRPIFIIDIALPRDVEPAVGELNGVYLYNLDDLQQVVAGTQQDRGQAVDAAKLLVDAAVEEYAAWHRTREMGPVIERLYERYHRIAREEVARTVKKLPNIAPAEREHLDALAHRIVNKLLHSPVRMLHRSEGLHTPTAQYLHAMEKLFDLAPPDQSSSNSKDEP